MTYNEFMDRAGCEKWPERWGEFFDGVREDFAYRGSPASDPSYYDYLESKYGIMGDDLETYKLICREVNKNEDLRLLLCLIIRAMKDRDFIYADLGSFRMKKSGDLASRSFTALAALSMVDDTYALLKKRGMPEDVILGALRLAAGGINDYPKRHGGEIGYELLGWFQLSVDGRLFRIGRLEFEFYAHFGARCVVYSDGGGGYAALANELSVAPDGWAAGSVRSAYAKDDPGCFEALVSEDENSYSGYLIAEDGRCDLTGKVTLPKSVWKPILRRRDPVIGVHIPGGGGLADGLVEESFDECRGFAKKYFPEFHYKCFYCHSWLMDPQLCDLLGDETNISKFNKRFRKITTSSTGRDVFHFVYLLGDTKNVDYSALDASTTLKRKVRDLYLSGGAISETAGWFI